MFRLISRAAIVCALCFSIGGHWAALQSVAWATMIVDYSRHVSLAEAVKQTFDGEHPCDLCKSIHAAEHQEKKQEAVSITFKPDLICAARKVTLRPRCTDFSFFELPTNASTRVDTPPTPPPRFELS
jgi:hypothetical protein